MRFGSVIPAEEVAAGGSASSPASTQSSSWPSLLLASKAPISRMWSG